MTQIFDESGKAYPGTVVEVSPLVVTKVEEGSVQVGFGNRKAKNLSKSVRGHIKKATGEERGFSHLKEFKTQNPVELGSVIDPLVVFNEGDLVVVSSISKGKGFQGVVKRHGFKGGPRTHGQKHSEREPGSIGAGGVQRVFKGTRMAGRMGGDRITVKNLPIIKLDKENNLIVIGGAIPGRRGTLVEIKQK